MASALPSSLIATAKSSGRFSPSLLSEERIIDGGVFESTLLRCLDGGERCVEGCVIAGFPAPDLYLRRINDGGDEVDTDLLLSEGVGGGLMLEIVSPSPSVPTTLHVACGFKSPLLL
jgi:hypothetical protein